MIKTEKVMKEFPIHTKYCDVCGVEIMIGLACSAIRCGYCKKDLCEDCIGYEGETHGDYRYGCCKRCWDIGAEYRPQIEKLHSDMDELHKIWQDRCKE